MKITVCYECQKRYPGCHSECEDYIRERKELDERNRIIKEAKYKNAVAESRKQDGLRKMSRSPKKRKGRRS